MNDNKRGFIEFMVRAGVISFGDFVTKSGRRTPYFINTGRFSTGGRLAQTGKYYAGALREHLGNGFDVLFGPAYKGIPLVTAAAIALHTEYGQDTAIAFNRKEVKDHGEGGALVGHVPQPGERVVIIEDVTTAGTSIREVVPMIQAQSPQAKLIALVVAVDRQERGPSGKGALAEVAETYGISTFAVVTIDEIVEHLSSHVVDGKQLIDAPLRERIAAYRSEFGA